VSKVSLILTVIGPDKPGLVESIADVVARHGANWLESRMAHLAGQFAGILRVEVDAQQRDHLTSALEKLAKLQLETVICPAYGGPDSEVEQAAGGHVAGAPASTREAVCLELVGQDHPGIVRDVTKVLAQSGVNVEELHTERSSAPGTGQLLFRATARLHLPEGLTEEKLRQALEQVAADLMVDLQLHG
jgi:glycine cleavage system regulatory protein